MRISVCVLALGLGLALVMPVQAQRKVSFTGVDPTQIVNQPINTINAAGSISTSQTVSTGFSLSKFFPSFGLPSNKPVIGRSVFPTNGQLPGRDYLKAFGWNNFQPFK